MTEHSWDEKIHVKPDGLPTEAFYAQLIQFLTHLVRRKVGNAEDIEDIVYETMSKVYQRVQPNQMSYWVSLSVRIVEAEIANHYRRLERDSNIQEFVEEGFLAQFRNVDETTIFLQREEVKQLAEKYLQPLDKLILSRSALGYTDSEICDVVGEYGYDIALKTIRNRRRLAINKLNSLLK